MTEKRTPPLPLPKLSHFIPSIDLVRQFHDTFKHPIAKELTPGTAELVEIINNGNQTVPTVLYPDGASATNPSLADVKKALG